MDLATSPAVGYPYYTPFVFATPAWPTSLVPFGPPRELVFLTFEIPALGRGGGSGAWFRPEGGTVEAERTPPRPQAGIQKVGDARSLGGPDGTSEVGHAGVANIINDATARSPHLQGKP